MLKLDAKLFLEKNRIVLKSEYHSDILKICRFLKEKKMAKWNASKKRWEFPLKEEIIERFKPLEIEIDEKLSKYFHKLKEEREAKLKAKEQEIELKTYLKNILHPYQRIGVGFLKVAKRAILADDMGLGKTLQTIALIDEANLSKILIVCPNSLKYVWLNEINKWKLPKKAIIIDKLNQRHPPEFYNKYDVWIINYEKIIIERYYNLLLSRNYDLLVFDEAHNLKNRKSKRSEAANILSKKADYLIEITGTPIMNRTSELWHLLHLLYPNEYKSYWKFVDRYAYVTRNYFGGYEVYGVKNEKKLRKELAPILIRRLKTEVLKELPEKTIEQIYLDLKPKQQKYYNAMEEEMSIELANDESLDAPTVLAKIIRLKQIAVTPKLLDTSLEFDNAKYDFVLDILNGTNDKVVIFSQFAKAIKLFAKELNAAGYKVVKYIGEMSPEERDKAITQFQSDDETRVFLATLQAGGVGITLTSANIAIFLDKHWTPAINEQAQDRLHRIGQKKNVLIYELIAKNTIEEYIEQLLESKKDIIQAILEKYKK